MKAIQWAQFSWDLSKPLPERPTLSPAFSIRRASPDDEESVRSIVRSGFTLDSEWNSFYAVIRPMVDGALDAIFAADGEPLCLVISHGPRVIGVSGLSVDRDACTHLLTGPCLALEYHNRGFASALLAHSLGTLREAGVAIARGVTKAGSTADQFIYPKFGATRAPAPESLTAELARLGRECRPVRA